MRHTLLGRIYNRVINTDEVNKQDDVYITLLNVNKKLATGYTNPIKLYSNSSSYSSFVNLQMT